MRRFKMNTWGGKQRTIDAEFIWFEIAHVVFANDKGSGKTFIVAAIKNEDVNDLQEVAPEDEQ